MIWHFFEVWGLLLVCFFVGCVFGVLLYAWIARTRFAKAQGALADLIGDAIDGIKSRLGIGPVWRPARPRPAARAAAAALNQRANGRTHESHGRRRRPRPHAAPGDDKAWESQIVPGTVMPSTEEDEFVEIDAVAAEIGAAASDRQMPEDDIVPMKPATLTAPRNGVPDDLQRIRGIGRSNEQLLNGLGIFHFAQIASWTPAEVRWVGSFLAFPERIERDEWIGQAIVLASGGKTDYAKAADSRRGRGD